MRDILWVSELEDEGSRQQACHKLRAAGFCLDAPVPSQSNVVYRNTSVQGHDRNVLRGRMTNFGRMVCGLTASRSTATVALACCLVSCIPSFSRTPMKKCKTKRGFATTAACCGKCVSPSRLRSGKTLFLAANHQRFHSSPVSGPDPPMAHTSRNPIAHSSGGQEPLHTASNAPTQGCSRSAWACAVSDSRLPFCQAMM